MGAKWQLRQTLALVGDIIMVLNVVSTLFDMDKIFFTDYKVRIDIIL